jgi:hypothetical protein
VNRTIGVGRNLGKGYQEISKNAEKIWYRHCLHVAALICQSVRAQRRTATSTVRLGIGINTFTHLRPTRSATVPLTKAPTIAPTVRIEPKTECTASCEQREELDWSTFHSVVAPKRWAISQVTSGMERSKSLMMPGWHGDE